MRINNYQGTVADRPIDTVVVEPETREVTQSPAQKGRFMDNVLSQMNAQNSIIPAGNLPVYDKGVQL